VDEFAGLPKLSPPKPSIWPFSIPVSPDRDGAEKLDDAIITRAVDREADARVVNSQRFQLYPTRLRSPLSRYFRIFGRL